MDRRTDGRLTQQPGSELTGDLAGVIRGWRRRTPAPGDGGSRQRAGGLSA